SPSTDPFTGITDPVTVFVRRVQGGGVAAGFWNWFMASQRLLRIGGLCKLGFGGIWGGFVFLVGSLGYFLCRKVLGRGDDTFFGTVDDNKKSIKVLTALMAKFNGASFIRVKKGDDIRIRELDGMEITPFGGPNPPDPGELGDQSFLTLKLKAEIDFT